MIFFNYKVSLGAISYLTKYKKKEYACVVHPKASGILLCPSGGACDASRHLKNILFRHIVGNVIVSFSYWCRGCHQWWSGLASVGAFFFPSSLLSLKNYSLTLLVFGISTSVLILLMSNFWSWSFCISFIYF